MTPSAEVYGPPPEGVQDAAWTWTNLLQLGVSRHACRGCVLSDGRFAVLGGSIGTSTVAVSSCEALVIGDDAALWQPFAPMHDARSEFTCEVVAGCIIVVGGASPLACTSAEIYDEALDRWFRLPCDFTRPWLYSCASALVKS